MKDGNNISGQGRKTCPFYDELDAILGTRAASCPPVVLDSGGGSHTVIPVADDEGVCQYKMYNVMVVCHACIYDHTTSFDRRGHSVTE